MKTSPRKVKFLAAFEADQSTNIERASVVTSLREKDTGGQVITFRCSDALLAAVDARAYSEHRNRTSLIRHALWTYLHERDGGTEAGISGAAGNGRRDLTPWRSLRFDPLT
jgi:predicted transcriptional regulator